MGAQALHLLQCVVVGVASREADQLNIGVIHATDNLSGHKVARNAITSGSKILRYGLSIGSATEDIAAGSHVHTHNIKSDYLASHHRDAVLTRVTLHPRLGREILPCARKPR